MTTALQLESQGLPASTHTEVAILGAMLLDTAAMTEAAAKLEASDFSLDSHQRIYRAILHLVEDRAAVDLTTVRAELERRRELDSVGGPAYLFYLTEGIPRNLSIGSYIRIVKDKSLLRSLMGILHDGATRAGDQGEDAISLAEELRKQLDEVAEDTGDADLERVGDYLAQQGEPEAIFEKLATVNGIKLGFPGLDEIIGGLLPGDLCIVAARPSMGKALRLDEPVLTTAGWKANRDLKVGDRLASVDGKESEVTGVFPQAEERQMYLVTFSDGRTLEADGSHLWSVRYRTWATARTLTTLQLGEMLSKKRYHGRLWIDTFSGCFGEHAHLPINPYVLGALIGNGDLEATPKFSTNDPETLERLRSRLPEYMEVRQESKYTYRLMDKESEFSGNNTFISHLRRLRLRGRKSHQKFIPKQYLESDREQRLELLRGLMDTDGNVEKTGSLVYSTSSPRLARDVVYLARSLGAVASQSDGRTPTYTYRGERKLGRVAYRVYISHSDARQFVSLERKQSRIPKRSRLKRLTVVSVDATTVQPCQCIAVSHPSQLYIASHGFVVTHNTAWACNVAQSLALREYRTVLFALEQKRQAMIRRMLASAARVDYRDIKEGRLREWERHLLLERRQMLAAAPLYIDDSPGLTTGRIRSKCSRLKNREGLDVVLIDQLSKVSRADCKQRDFRLQIGEQTAALKLMGQELGVPVVVFNQLGRDTAKRTDPTPRLEDLKESGNIEEDADVVIFLHREEYYDKSNEDVRGKGQMIAAKVREGPTGTVDCQYQGRILRWDDDTQPAAEQGGFDQGRW